MAFASPTSRLSIAASVWGDPRPYRKGVHEGVDLLMPSGTPVMAMEGGTIVTAVSDPCADAAGKHVSVVHDGGGFRTTYMHLSLVSVSKGKHVSKGQVIGLSGKTGGDRSGIGCTFGNAQPHLHVTVRQNMSQIVTGTPTGSSSEHEGATFFAVPAEPYVPADYTSVSARLARLGIRPWQAVGIGVALLAALAIGAYLVFKKS